MKTAAAAGLIFLLLLGGCSKDPGRIAVEHIKVDFVWDLEHLHCSPEIHLENVPQGTELFRIEFIDATNEWEHGGGNIANEGSPIVPAGAFKTFKGLSSTWGIPDIRLNVVALGKDNRILGKGTVVKNLPTGEIIGSSVAFPFAGRRSSFISPFTWPVPNFVLTT